MCDIKRFQLIYNEIDRLTSEETLQLILESESEEERDFYEMVGNFLLQKRQREVIEERKF